MTDCECLKFLCWAVPKLGMCCRGFRRVRGQVCKRLRRRLQDLGIEDFEQYTSFLAENPDEWKYLPFLLRVTISRFYRDRSVFDAIRDQVLPVLAARADQQGTGVLRCWSAGCASGEEVYTLKIVEREGRKKCPAVPLGIVATDIDPAMLARGRQGMYRKTSLKELPPGWLEESFDVQDDEFRVRDSLRERIQWLCQDIREQAPAGPFDLVLCRNLAFTYFDIAVQRRIADRLAAVILEDGALVIGKHEVLPEKTPHFSPWIENLRIYRRRSGSD